MTDQSRPDCFFDELELSMNVNKGTVKDMMMINKMFAKIKQQKVVFVFSNLTGQYLYSKSSRWSL